MRFYGSSRLRVSVLIGCLFFIFGAMPAFAGPGDRHEKQAEQFDKMLEQAASSEGADAAREDIQQARKWLDDARLLLAKGNEEAAGTLLRRVKFSVELIDALTKAGTIQQAADEQEAAYYRAQETQIPELEAEVQQLKERKQELEEQLQTLR